MDARLHRPAAVVGAHCTYQRGELGSVHRALANTTGVASEPAKSSEKDALLSRGSAQAGALGLPMLAPPGKAEDEGGKKPLLIAFPAPTAAAPPPTAAAAQPSPPSRCPRGRSARPKPPPEPEATAKPDKSGPKKSDPKSSLDELLNGALNGKQPVGAGKSDAAANLREKPTRDDVLNAMKGVTDAVKACGTGQSGVAFANVTVSGKTARVGKRASPARPARASPRRCARPASPSSSRTPSR